MTTPDGSTRIEYVKSSASDAEVNCVEVGWDPVECVIAVRHSKRTTESPLLFSPSEWVAFLTGVRAGEFDPEQLAG